MADISNKTLAILVVAVLMTSLLSTWLILSQRSVDLSWMEKDANHGQGLVRLYIEGAEIGEPLQGGKVTLIVLPPESGPIE